jgi:hypothetical protein
MKTASHTTGSSGVAKGRVLPKYFVRFSLLLLLAATLAPHSVFAAGPKVAEASAGPGLPFAIADFDGDSHLDYASVQTGRGDATTGDYWIRLRLSASGRRYIRVAAPVGGLRIEARDVNGDNAVDLVFASQWLDQPMAILLNDGHGNFSQVSPSAYLRTLHESNLAWHGTVEHDWSTAGMPQELRSGNLSSRSDWRNFQVRHGPVCFPDAPLPPNSFLSLSLARAPPSSGLVS